jgi:hypothetical protein
MFHRKKRNGIVSVLVSLICRSVFICVHLLLHFLSSASSASPREPTVSFSLPEPFQLLHGPFEFFDQWRPLGLPQCIDHSPEIPERSLAAAVEMAPK